MSLILNEIKQLRESSTPVATDSEEKTASFFDNIDVNIKVDEAVKPKRQTNTISNSKS